MNNYKKYFTQQLRPFKWHLLGLVFISIVWAIDTSLRPYLIKMIIDRIAESAGAKIWLVVMGPAIFYIITSVLVLSSYRFYNVIRRNFVPALKRNITSSMMGHLFLQTHQYYQNNFAGSLANKINDVAYGLSDVISIATGEFLGGFLGLLVAIGVLFTVRPWVAGIFIIWVSLFLIGSWHFARQSHVLSDRASEKRSDMSGKVVDILSNMSVVRLFARRSFEQERVNAWGQEVAEAERKFDQRLNVLFGYQSISFLIMNAVMLFYLLEVRSKGLISIGDFALVFTLNTSIVDSLWNMGRQFITFSEQLGKLTQGLRILLQAPSIKDVPNAKTLLVKEGEIEFHNVSFAYQTPALFNGLSVKIPPGQKVGLVGYSGSGKTTFVNLIMRLYDIHGGAILVDGQPIDKVKQESLREAISFIPQDPTLFHRSILENIRYGRPEASIADVIEAAKAAHSHEFIMKLPQAYETTVGERGVKLSGGQRQRIAIARAILKNAKIAILDEATSALDSVTEQLIQDSLLKLSENRTTLVIAHRLSTLIQMDRILVFDRGKIVEEGSHEELLLQNGMYEKLWYSQINGFLPEDWGNEE